MRLFFLPMINAETGAGGAPAEAIIRWFLPRVCDGLNAEMGLKVVMRLKAVWAGVTE